MRRATLIFGVLLVLVSCTTSEKVRLPDGSTGYNISCDGMVQSMGDCFAKAGELCPKGYDVYASGNESTPIYTSSGTFSANQSTASGGYVTQRGAVIYRDVFVKCK